MFTCTKIYPEIPFAHRNHKHEGHCKYIHGHNWSFEITFGCRQRDGCGFVMDFGQLKEVRNFINNNYDHALIIAKDDPLLKHIQGTQIDDAFGRVCICPDTSSEGIALHLFQQVNYIVSNQTGGRVFVTEVIVREGSKNSAIYRPDNLLLEVR